MASIRDYDRVIAERPVVQGPFFYSDPQGRRIVFQVWDWVDDQRYVFHLYITRKAARMWQTFHTSAPYRALRRNELVAVLSQARFRRICWLEPSETGFYQPIVLAEVN